jgi:hypothetical protein
MCTTSTVACWYFDLDLKESCSHPAFDGTPTGNASTTGANAAPIGRNRGCLVLDGSPSRVDLAAPTTIGHLSEGSLEAWIYLDAGPATDSFTIFNVGTAKLHTDLAIGVLPPSSTGDPLQLTVDINDSVNAPVALPDLGSMAWHHIAVTWDGTNHRYYFDGQLIATIANGATPYFTGDEAQIGSDDQELGYFVGRIDEVRLSSRALTRTELAAGHFCPADYNHDGFVDGIDYDQFNNDFEAGC